jgi:hypothetical protein
MLLKVLVDAHMYLYLLNSVEALVTQVFCLDKFVKVALSKHFHFMEQLGVALLFKVFGKCILVGAFLVPED